MPELSEITKSTIMPVTYECENCGVRNHYNFEIIKTGKCYGSIADASEQADSLIQRKIDKILEQVENNTGIAGIEIQNCPNCDYLQSWMQVSAKKICYIASAAIGGIVSFLISIPFLEKAEEFWGDFFSTNMNENPIGVLFAVFFPAIVGAIIVSLIVGTILSYRINSKFPKVKVRKRPKITQFPSSY